MPVAYSTHITGWSTAAASTGLSANVSVTEPGSMVLLGWFYDDNSTQSPQGSSTLINSTAATFLFESPIRGTARQQWIYYSFPSATGLLPVQVVGSSAIGARALAAVVFTGVSTSAPFSTYFGSSGGSTVASTVVNSSAGDLVFGFIIQASTDTFTPNASMTEIFDDFTSTNTPLRFAGAYQAGAATVNMSWASTVGTGHVFTVMNINAAAAAAQPSGGISWWY